MDFIEMHPIYVGCWKTPRERVNSAQLRNPQVTSEIEAHESLPSRNPSFKRNAIRR